MILKWVYLDVFWECFNALLSDKIVMSQAWNKKYKTIRPQDNKKAIELVEKNEFRAILNQARKGLISQADGARRDPI
jgi:hypothetical protein